MFPLAESPSPMLTIPLNITPKIPFQLRKGIHLVKKGGSECSYPEP